VGFVSRLVGESEDLPAGVFAALSRRDYPPASQRLPPLPKLFPRMSRATTINMMKPTIAAQPYLQQYDLLICHWLITYQTKLAGCSAMPSPALAWYTRSSPSNGGVERDAAIVIERKGRIRWCRREARLRKLERQPRRFPGHPV